MKEKNNLKKFMDKLIQSLKEEGRYNTAHIYQSTLNSFIQFTGSEKVRLDQLKRSNLKLFESHLRNKGRSWNTVSTYMRTLQSTYNKAVDEGLAVPDARLFSHVYTGVKITIKRALEAEEMNRLVNTPPIQPLSESLEKSRVWITLMFLFRGMPFVDLAYLLKKDLQGSTLSYRRRKTGSELTVKVTPEAMRLIERYQSADPDSPYLFPILNGNKTAEEAYMEYQHSLRKLNHDLKLLATHCGLKPTVSTYTARHTWATLAKYCHFSGQLICDALGHSSVKMTETYLKCFKNDELDKANKVIIRHINKSERRSV